MSSPKQSVRIEPAGRTDVTVLLTLIRELAAYENMSDQVIATEAHLSRAMFSSSPQAEAVPSQVELWHVRNVTSHLEVLEALNRVNGQIPWIPSATAKSTAHAVPLPVAKYSVILAY